MKIAPNVPRFEIDLGGRRFTHNPSGDTLLRHDYLRWDTKKHPDWKAQVIAFADRHSDTYLMTDCNRRIVDDIRTWPTVGGRFQVGDFVVTRGSDERPAVARQIIASVSATGYPDRTVLDFDETFILEDGEMMWWSSDSDCWTGRDHRGEFGRRLRPLLPEENVEDIRYSPRDMAIRIASDLEFAIRGTVHPWGSTRLDLACQVSHGTTAADLAAVGDALTDLMEGSRSGRIDESGVVDRILPILTSARSMNLVEIGKETDIGRGSTSLFDASRRANVVLETLQRRSLEEVPALTP